MRSHFGAIAESYIQDPNLINAVTQTDETQNDFIWDNLNNLRPELYALLAIVIDQSVDNLFSQIPNNPPFGLANRYGEPIEHIRDKDQYLDMLQRSLVRTMSATTASNRDARCPVQQKLDKITQLFYPSHQDLEAGTTSGIGEATDILLSTGAGTAIKIFSLGHTAITRKLENSSLTTEQKQLALSHCTDLFHRAAGVNIDQLGAIMAIFKNESDSDDKAGEIEIEQKPNGLAVVRFTRPISKMENPLAYDGSTIGEIKSPLTKLGCPARVSLGGKPSAISKLWYLANTSFYKAKI
jgi:hypothetical protein